MKACNRVRVNSYRCPEFRAIWTQPKPGLPGGRCGHAPAKPQKERARVAVAAVGLTVRHQRLCSGVKHDLFATLYRPATGH